MPQMELYENKHLRDPELPIQLSVSSEGCANHWHEHLELHYIVDGEADFYLNQIVCHGMPGNLIVVNPSELHSVQPTQTPYCARIMIFNIADLSQELASQNHIFYTCIHHDTTANMLTAHIFDEFQRRQACWKQQARALVLELLVHLCRNHVACSLAYKESVRRKKHLERLNTVLCYIEEHYNEPISLRQLAEMTYLSEDRFSHLFRDSVGRPPLQYINELRLKKAAVLLKAQEYTVTAVADMVGFRDYNHFSRQFRKKYGCTPYDVKTGKSIPQQEQ